MKAYEKYEVDEMFNNWQEDLKQLTTLNVIPIPDNATNGEVLETMFLPNRITKTDNIVHVEYDFTPEWWKSLYTGRK